MKISLLGVLAVLSCVGVADAANTGRSRMYSSIDMRNSNGDTIQVKRSTSKSYNGKHVQRSNKKYNYNREAVNTNAKRSGMYDNIETVSQQPVSQPRPEQIMTAKQTYTKGETIKSMKRKYFIANPFYQPLKGQFGTVTTGEYLQGKYNIDGIDVNRKMTEWSIKEDLSFGLTDRIALQGMAKYDSDKLSWHYTDDDSTMDHKKHGLNTLGIGLQGRVIDTDDWIATLSGYYEHQKHGTDYFIADFKAGYKVATSTIYGLVRGWAINTKNYVYGDYLDTMVDVGGGVLVPAWAFLEYGDSKDTVFMGEAAMGVWTVLAEDWTLNVEGMFGAYDWHNQFSIKGAFGWQPNDTFALNLYAKTSLYDSGNNHLKAYYGLLPLTQEHWDGKATFDVELSKMKEYSVGLQVMFQF